MSLVWLLGSTTLIRTPNRHVWNKFWKEPEDWVK